MNMKRGLYVGLFLLLAGCAGRGNQKQADTVVSDVSAKETIEVPSDSGVVRMVLTGGHGEMLIRKEPRNPVYLEFKTGNYRKVSAEIIPQSDSVANIRISQVVLPDGTMDGPFGRTVEYDIPSPGILRLVIGESLMQGDPWGGVFRAEVTLTE
jgi:hypothetical protein